MKTQQEIDDLVNKMLSVGSAFKRYPWADGRFYNVAISNPDYGFAVWVERSENVYFWSILESWIVI